MPFSTKTLLISRTDGWCRSRERRPSGNEVRITMLLRREEHCSERMLGTRRKASSRLVRTRLAWVVVRRSEAKASWTWDIELIVPAQNQGRGW